MSVILDAVRGELAEAEKERAAIDARVDALRNIEALALAMNGEPREPEPEPEPEALEEPPPDTRRGDVARAAAKARAERASKPDSEEERPTRRHGPRSTITDEDIEAAARAVLPIGRVTPNQVCRKLGSHSASITRRAQELFARLEADGVIVPDKERNGRPSFKLAEEAAPSPEPDAPASTTDDSGAGEAGSDSPSSDEEPKEEVEDFGLVDDDTAETVVDELEDYEEGRRPRGQGETGLPPEWSDIAERIKALCENEPRTTAAMAEILDEDRQLVRKVTEKLVRLGELSRRGWAMGTTNPKYGIPPTLADQGVTVKQADRSEDLDVVVRRQLRLHGRQSIAALATKLVRHPRDIALCVQEMLRNGEVKKHAGTPDARYELVAG